MADKDLALMAHLLRRAGFGSSRDELEGRVAQGYDNVVEELLNPGDGPGIEEDMLYRSYPAYIESAAIAVPQTEIVYRMINNEYQLQEKMALFGTPSCVRATTSCATNGTTFLNTIRSETWDGQLQGPLDVSLQRPLHALLPGQL